MSAWIGFGILLVALIVGVRYSMAAKQRNARGKDRPVATEWGEGSSDTMAAMHLFPSSEFKVDSSSDLPHQSHQAHGNASAHPDHSASHGDACAYSDHSASYSDAGSIDCGNQ